MEDALTGMVKKNLVYVLVVLYSIGIPLLILSPKFFAFAGFAIASMAFSTLLFGFKKHRSDMVKILYGMSLFFSFCVLYRANAFLTFLNVIATMVATTSMALIDIEPEEMGFMKFMHSPLRLFAKTVDTVNAFRVEVDSRLFHRPSQLLLEGKRMGELIVSVAISLILLGVIIPLLASTNPFFQQAVENFFNLFNFEWLLKLLQFKPINVYQILLGINLLYFLPKLLSSLNLPNKPSPVKTVDFSLLLPKIAVGVVLLFYFVTQLQLYTSTEQTLADLGYTNRQYAREVFGQLTVVSVILVGLIYNDQGRKKWDQRLSTLLIVQGLFLAAMAFKSVFDYTGLHGLTFKRLWGFTGVFWITTVFGFLSYMLWYEKSHRFFVRAVIVLSGVTLMLVNVLNFDYMIYHVRQPLNAGNPDHRYMADLSADSLSYRQQLERLDRELAGKVVNSNEYFNAVGSSWMVFSKASYLLDKYEHIDWRTFNLSEYRQYLQIKEFKDREYFKNQAGRY